jgi:hypothetical protein
MMILPMETFLDLLLVAVAHLHLAVPDHRNLPINPLEILGPLI